MTRRSRAFNGEFIADTLDHFRSRTSIVEEVTPKCYKEVRERLEKVQKSGKKVVIEVKDSYNLQVVVVQLTSVQPRWFLGHSTCYSGDAEVKVPYTVHFSDIIGKTSKIFVEGENPFD